MRCLRVAMKVMAIASVAGFMSAVQAITLTPAQGPLFVATSIKPMVMIDMSKDHSLFFKAYNDYTALNASSTTIQTTYDNTIAYYGYFDSDKCYDYDSGNGYFKPIKLAASHYCTGNWSGNFMNWATMTRMDAIRKLLYGGYRSTDTSTTTVLKRAALQTDAHAFAKFYNGSDLNKLTPFSSVKPAPMSASGYYNITNGGGSTMPLAANDSQYRVPGAANTYQNGDEILAVPNGVGPNQYMIGHVFNVQDIGSDSYIAIHVVPNGVHSTGSPTNMYSAWTFTQVNMTDGGITLCNVSTSATGDPLIRVARGNYSLWGANERWQCRWFEEANGTAATGSSNNNVALVSSINAATDNPQEAFRGLNSSPGPTNQGEYRAFIKVCDNSTVALKDGSGAPAGSENCRQYPSGDFKPIGLLQTYGDNDQMQFALMTGSYTKNISGGVLRRGMANFSSEINTTTDGTFVGSVKGIVYNLNQFQVARYDFVNGGYFPPYPGDNCWYQLVGLVHTGATGGYANEGSCSSWGNPISEIYLESLRYLAGKQPTPAFAYTAGGTTDDIVGNGLTEVPWTDPLSASNYCAALNAIVINPSISSYDNDLMGGISDLNSPKTANAWTKIIGDNENITGNSWFVGSAGGTSSTNSLCTAKTVNDLGAVTGICPEAGSQLGTYLIAGTAYYAHTNKIRNDIPLPTNDTTSFKVTTYAVQLATATPKITVDVGGNPVTIEPSYRVGGSNGTIVDFKIISQTANGGSFYVNWEDSAQGGDFDQDTWGILSYTIVGNQISVTTVAVSSVSNNGQGFGYIISGTNHDGAHFHSGAYGYVYNDPNPISVTPTSFTDSSGTVVTFINSSGGCNNCTPTDPPTTAVYIATGIQGSTLKDPLYYAAKWGSFNTLTGTLPSASDGTNNYFYVTNPASLETSLGSALVSISKKASATAIAANSTSLQSATSVFQALFNPNDWSSEFLSYPINHAGAISSTPSWDAGALLASPNFSTRMVLSYDNVTTTKGGIPFRFASLPSAYQTVLNKNVSGVTDSLGSQRVDWLRGDDSNEGTSLVTNFRVRSTTKLGDIVNSNPLYVGAPGSGYADSGYAAFVNSYASRANIVYVGGNDGMLHGFSALDGTEKLAYIPSVTMSNLSALTAQGYSHQYYVDGSPVSGDVYMNSQWRTLLVGGMNRGGRAVYALDITDPSRFTEANAASLVQWEFTNANDSDLGYTYGRPALVKLANGKWAAIFGNGYNSTGGKAYLFIVFLDRAAGSKSWVSGTDYIKIATNNSTGNGLSEILPVGTLGNGVTNYVYAGDLNGNMWKFDLSDVIPANWKLAYSTPLFTTPSQPITSSPDVIRGSTSGYIVVFGTGLYLQSSDTGTKTVQSLYGVWDDPSNYKQAILDTVTPANTNLQLQTINNEVSVGGEIARVTSNNTVDYSTKRGWYMNLVSPVSGAQGERVVYNPTIYNGRVTITSLIPATSACDNGGSGWLMELDARTGSRTTNPVLDVNGDGIISSNDLVTIGSTTAAASGFKTNGIPAGYTRLSNDSTTNKVYTGGLPSTVITESATGSSGRLSWREIMR